jgi:hypothetical protein
MTGCCHVEKWWGGSMIRVSRLWIESPSALGSASWDLLLGICFLGSASWDLLWDLLLGICFLGSASWDLLLGICVGICFLGSALRSAFGSTRDLLGIQSPTAWDLYAWLMIIHYDLLDDVCHLTRWILAGRVGAAFPRQTVLSA